MTFYHYAVTLIFCGISAILDSNQLFISYLCSHTFERGHYSTICHVWEGYGYYMKIQESAENYLETILVLKKKNGVVRSIDIANDLGVSKPSVSVAMKNLRNGEYIEMDKDGYITLLDKGLEIAEKIYERHTFLTDWLTSIGVDPAVAAEDACRIEHVISAETFSAMKKTLKTK